jgi:aminoglycoside phosphotransferase (APT) family kinase protein
MSQFPGSPVDIATLHAAIVAHDPSLRGSRFVVHQGGWDSVAIEIDDRLIFKFPRDDLAGGELVREARMIAALRPHVRLAVPDLRIITGPPVFSRHEKLHGEHLVTAQYNDMPEAARNRLASDLAGFFADLHSVPHEAMRAAGARPIEPWYEADTIAARALPWLDGELRSWAVQTLGDWLALGPDPFGETYGFFDGHGWNMAFDHEAQRLNGVYDFGDSGSGQLHQEFVYPALIARDLVERILPLYAHETGRQVDARRVRTLIGVHRLFELAQHHDDPPNRPQMLQSLVDWIADLR